MAVVARLVTRAVSARSMDSVNSGVTSKALGNAWAQVALGPMGAADTMMVAVAAIEADLDID